MLIESTASKALQNTEKKERKGNPLFFLSTAQKKNSVRRHERVLKLGMLALVGHEVLLRVRDERVVLLEDRARGRARHRRAHHARRRRHRRGRRHRRRRQPRPRPSPGRNRARPLVQMVLQPVRVQVALRAPGDRALVPLLARAPPALALPPAGTGRRRRGRRGLFRLFRLAHALPDRQGVEDRELRFEPLFLRRRARDEQVRREGGPGA